MGVQIEGFGAGYIAAVKANGHLLVDAVAISGMAHEGAEHGDAYSFSNLTYNYTALDTILLVKNTSQTKKFFVSTIVIAGDTTTEVVIHRPVAEVTPTGTAVTGVNISDSSNSAPATAIADETDNTRGGVVLSTRIPADTPYTWDIGGALILTTNDSLGVDFVTVGAAANVTILGYFR